MQMSPISVAQYFDANSIKFDLVIFILTDVNNYYNAVTTKDREIIQVDVLNQLGWEIYKIWSTEWWESRGKVMAGYRRR